MRRHWYFVIAGAIAAALAVVPLSAAAASNVLTIGSTSGAGVAVGDSLVGTLSGNATFVNTANSNQKVTCTGSSVSATDLTNPAPGGTATESVSSQTFSGCTLSGVFGASINSVSTNASGSCPWGGAVTDGSGTNNVTISPNTGTCGGGIIQATVVVSVFGINQNCVYKPHATAGTLTGSAPLGSSAGITFTNQQFDKTSGPGTCFASANFSATYPFKVGTQAVFTN